MTDIDNIRLAAIDWAEREYRNVDEFTGNDLEIAIKAYAAGRASAPPVILPVPTEGDAIAKCKHILGLVDDFHNIPNSANRRVLRMALMAEFEAAAPALQEGSEQPPENQQEGQPAALRAGLIPCAYRIGPVEFDAIKIEECRQMEGPPLWAVRRNGGCMNKGGDWEYEPMPSSRDDEFLSRCRFASAQEALKIAAPVEQTTSTDTNNEKGQA
jgi:hypothetical protein